MSDIIIRINSKK